tara:strand:+ start:272 stop:790 length:519 start_codon:yes stop_codon:yes gene_type:complete
MEHYHVSLHQKKHMIDVQVEDDEHNDEFVNRLQITWPVDWPNTGNVDFVYGWGDHSYSGAWSEITFSVPIINKKVRVTDPALWECIRKFEIRNDPQSASAKDTLRHLLLTLSDQSRRTPLEFARGSADNDTLKAYNDHFMSNRHVLADIAGILEKKRFILFEDSEDEEEEED